MSAEKLLVKLAIVPMSLDEANAYVSQHHRHHDPVTGHKYSIAVSDEAGKVRGVAIVGRPVSRMSDNGWTLEVNRCCTDGVPNGCSMLYRAAWRAARAMGYTRLITYTLPEEGGGSLKGAGFRLVGERGGGKWNRASRPRVDTAPTQTKWLWEVQDDTQPSQFCGRSEREGAVTVKQSPKNRLGAAGAQMQGRERDTASQQILSVLTKTGPHSQPR